MNTIHWYCLLITLLSSLVNATAFVHNFVYDPEHERTYGQGLHLVDGRHTYEVVFNGDPETARAGRTLIQLAPPIKHNRNHDPISVTLKFRDGRTVSYVLLAKGEKYQGPSDGSVKPLYPVDVHGEIYELRFQFTADPVHMDVTYTALDTANRGRQFFAIVVDSFDHRVQ